MGATIKSGRMLDCGCCGLGFETWKGYQDQDQDRDYGICSHCQGEGSVKTEAEYDKALAEALAKLGPKALARNKPLLEEDPDFKYVLVNSAVDQGLISWEKRENNE